MRDSLTLEERAYICNVAGRIPPLPCRQIVNCSKIFLVVEMLLSWFFSISTSCMHMYVGLLIAWRAWYLSKRSRHRAGSRRWRGRGKTKDRRGIMIQSNCRDACSVTSDGTVQIRFHWSLRFALPRLIDYVCCHFFLSYLWLCFIKWYFLWSDFKYWGSD